MLHFADDADNAKMKYEKKKKKNIMHRITQSESSASLESGT